MALTLVDLKRMHDKGFDSGQITRERAADDMVFALITQWDEAFLSESDLGYRGEFNILKKAIRQILSDLASNPVQVDFEPLDGTRDDAAELIDGIYRTDDQNNVSIESYENGKQEAVICGVGAWALYTDYVSLQSSNKNQTVKRRPIFEANNTVFWDPNAKLLDKSDAGWVDELRAYSEDGYLDLVEELTGERPKTIDADSFKQPDQSYTFPWIGGEGKKIYVVEFYHREIVKEKILTMVDPFGMESELREKALESVMDEMMDHGYTIESEKMTERYQVTKYIASGSEILNGEMKDGERVGEIIAGQHIPIVPCYGEHAYVEGEEHYEGITRLAKDPQRLRNFIMSYVADIASRSPRPKPIFTPEQIAGFANMYDVSGADNNLPYYLLNSKDEDGQPIPIGAIPTMPEQQVPTALPLLIDLTRQAVEDVANPGIPQDVADVDLAGKAIMALQARLDMQSMIYQTHFKHAKRRDAEIHASMSSEIHDVPRKQMVTAPDGTRKQIDVMSAIWDEETDEMVILNDLRSAEFEVYTKIGPDYKSQKEQTVASIDEKLGKLDPNSPAFKILMLKSLELTDGIDTEEIREYSNKELIKMGIREPDTDEEIAMMQEIQNQPEKPDPMMLAAQAEMEKGKADQMQAKTADDKNKMDFQIRQQEQKIEIFRAETERMKVQVEAQKAGATISKTQVDTQGSHLDNQLKVKDLLTPTASATM